MGFSDEQIIEALYSTANDHDVVEAVKAMMGEVWDEGYLAGASAVWKGEAPNPYRKED